MNEQSERIKSALSSGFLLLMTQGFLLFFLWKRIALNKEFLIALMLTPVVANVISVYLKSKYKTFRISKRTSDGSMFRGMLNSKKTTSLDTNIYRVKNEFTVFSVAFSVKEYENYYEVRAPGVFKKLFKQYGVNDASHM